MSFLKRHIFKIIIASMSLLVVVFLFCTYNTGAFRGEYLVAENASQYGSFVGGVLGTLLSFVSILLVILTIREQKNTHYKDSFETKFLAMIQLHRDNVSEMMLNPTKNIETTPTLHGRNVMKQILEEYKVIYRLCWQNYFSKLKPESNITDAIAYCTLYYGKTEELNQSLRKLEISCTANDLLSSTNIFSSYTRFSGYQVYLGHYYRHLYQTVKFVDDQPGLSDEEKYAFVKMLRAQLSTDEQALLLLNSISPLGKAWHEGSGEELGYMTKYKLIKNIPDKFITIDIPGGNPVVIEPKNKFPDITFEYEE